MSGPQVLLANNNMINQNYVIDNIMLCEVGNNLQCNLRPICTFLIGIAKVPCKLYLLIRKIVVIE